MGVYLMGVLQFGVFGGNSLYLNRIGRACDVVAPGLASGDA
jgi:hypothetical protein